MAGVNMGAASLDIESVSTGMSGYYTKSAKRVLSPFFMEFLITKYMILRGPFYS